ncbi:hypothetical protein N7491_000089 [Penicillium cf. griseofulvum]|uniref:Uncharacterized protein n=1 Tax=Penicillium cf. griseofulvum TaxID=2972120 RepID=A0A9W9JM02_9EURO|nr:hypothetical protein N7472_004559 [Penicillium cf. griseofulvum]KAJ5442121.1 hypothetical protein N7445_005128 [Penicillium cf. griseofulvum]KAJ5450907.1 hypothetical protein N7491_000089 [Penicillium cf. griseofulvum]
MKSCHRIARNPVPAPFDIALTAAARDLSPQPKERTAAPSESEGDIKRRPGVAQEIQAEAARCRFNSGQSGSQLHHNQGFSHWVPFLGANSPVRLVSDPIKPDIPTYTDNGGTGSSEVAKQSTSETATPTTPIRRKDIFILWSPSPGKKAKSTEKGNKRDPVHTVYLLSSR